MADAASADAASAESADAARASASVDARAVAAFLLDGRHLCSAFELYMDLLASSADAAQGRPDAASALAREATGGVLSRGPAARAACDPCVAHLLNDS